MKFKHPKIVEWWIDLHHPPPVMKDGDQELVGATNERRMREYRETKRPYRQAYIELGMGLRFKAGDHVASRPIVQIDGEFGSRLQAFISSANGGVKTRISRSTPRHPLMLAYTLSS